MIKVALIGLGRIGQMHAENLFSHKSFKLPVSLDNIKKHRLLEHLPLLKQSRLSVMIIDSKSWKIICKMGRISM